MKQTNKQINKHITAITEEGGREKFAIRLLSMAQQVLKVLCWLNTGFEVKNSTMVQVLVDSVRLDVSQVLNYFRTNLYDTNH